MALGTYNPPADRIVHTTRVDFIDRDRLGTVVHLVQGDKTTPIIAVEMYKNGQPYPAPAGVEGNVRWHKPIPDRYFVYNPLLGLSTDRTIAYFEVTGQMSTTYGEVHAIIELQSGLNIVGSSSIPIFMDKNPIQSDDMESTDEVKSLKDLVKDAAGSATAAADSADAAAKSAAAAAASQTAAKASETAAKDSENAAKASQDAAAKSAAEALTSQNASKESETNASASEAAALGSQNAAKESENAAKASQEAAKESENAAKASQNAAAASEANAEEYAQTAIAKASEASISEGNAAASADAALASQEAAKESEDNAAVSAAKASASQDAAAASETNAAASETAAEDWSNVSKSWAIGEGMGDKRPDEATDNSKWYAQQAKESSDAAVNSAQIVVDNADNIEFVRDNMDGILAAPDAALRAEAAADSAEFDADRAAEAADRAQSIAQGAKGWYATPEALNEAIPNGERGDWGIVGSTDTIWIWDTDAEAWSDSGNKTDLSQYYTKDEADAENNKLLAQVTQETDEKLETKANADDVNTALDGKVSKSGDTMSGPLTNESGFVGPLTGNASTASKLLTPRSLKTKLDSTTAVTFDGSGNQDAIPVTGILGTANGGTGNANGKAPTAGAADTAARLAPGANINGVLFTGASPITVYDSTKMPLNTWQGAVDFNTLLRSGFYQVQGVHTNAPTAGDSHYHVMVMRHADAWVRQIAFDVRNSVEWARGRLNGVWSSWQKISHDGVGVAASCTGNAATANSAGYATSAGSATRVSQALTFTGAVNTSYDGSAARTVNIPTSTNALTLLWTNPSTAAVGATTYTIANMTAYSMLVIVTIASNNLENRITGLLPIVDGATTFITTAALTDVLYVTSRQYVFHSNNTITIGKGRIFYNGANHDDNQLLIPYQIFGLK